MRHSADEPTAGTASVAAVQPGRKSYTPPTLHEHGTVRDLTLTTAAGPNFDGGGGANIYMS